ncbi:MAG: glucose 1-dehydrogenase [Acidobacteriota bacterium]|jgi:NAD(P)-dependent dehydrogenase (short-subunit alcohol dehydrogenase family)
MTDAPEDARDLLDLSGKVALVTGASRGIGEAIARTYAAAGASVVLASRTQEALDTVAAGIRKRGGTALPIACHTGDGEQVAGLVERAVAELGRIDVLVNNAGTNPHFGPLLTAEESHWQKTLDVNLLGYFRLAKACVPVMRERTGGGGGKIVNVASIIGHTPHPGLGVYAVTKAGVIMLTRVLAQELGGDGIQVNALAPGIIKTRFSEALWKEPERSRAFLEQIPAGRFGEAGDLLGLALYLASPASDYTTGAVFTVDGGQTG